MYEIALHNQIKKILKEGFTSYDEIFRRSKGAFPDIVFPIIKNLIEFPEPELKTAAINVPHILPEPNPSNFDWRFDQGTISFMCDLLSKYKVLKIALFGGPSLFSSLTKQYKEVLLFDINNLLVDALGEDRRVIITDINYLDTAKYGKFDCVILDPPWYLSYYQNWFQKANEMLADNGMLISTLFQELLRPDAKSELIQIIDNANAIGKVKIVPDSVSYITPNFEKRIFTEKHIPVSGNWRIADLIIVNKQYQTDLPIIKIPKDDWERIEINNKVIAIRQETNISHISATMPFQTNAQLLTVSDRDPIKKVINLITSDNQGLIVSGTSRITKFLKGLAEGETRDTLIKKMNISPSEQGALKTILKLINL